MTDSSVPEPEEGNKPPFVCARRRGSPRRSGVGGLMKGVWGRVPQRVWAAPKVWFWPCISMAFRLAEKEPRRAHTLRM
ncbi:hypothetical protein A3781_19890 [Bacillus badius]|nr:hypothetical protein A3781_19890 [Bacillus badius]